MFNEKFEMQFEDEGQFPMVQGRLLEHTAYFRTNWAMRHDVAPDWRRRHRHLARKAIGEIRYLTGRPRKNINFGLNRSGS
jgi:hypothetical protein